MLFGPILHSELLMTARRKRYYVARVLYGFVLLYALHKAYANWNETLAVTYVGELGLLDSASWIKSMARFAMSSFLGFAAAQGVTLLSLVPALVAGVIADEHQRKTLHYLLASQFSSATIILGKLVARLLFVGSILSMGIPVTCLIALFGGLDPQEVAYIYVGTLSTILFLVGLSMLVSVMVDTPRRAIVTAYMLEAAWLFLPLLISSISEYFRNSGMSWLISINNYAILLNPIHTWNLVTEGSWVNSISNRRAAGGGTVSVLVDSFVLERFYLMVGLQTSFGLMFLLLAIAGLRPLRGGGGPWEHRRTIWFPTLRRWATHLRPACGADPMLWKERPPAGGGIIGWVTSFPVILILVAHLTAYLLPTAIPAFQEFRYGSSRIIAPPYASRIALNSSLRDATVPLFGFVLVVVGMCCRGECELGAREGAPGPA